jgi:ABC-type polysaccharide/polyol phosphate export permease
MRPLNASTHVPAAISSRSIAVADFVDGARAWRVWTRLGWQEIKRRYRRTLIGPLWTSLSLGLFICVLGVVWARFWNLDAATYLPFLCAGLLSWNLVQSLVIDGCGVFVGGERFIKQMRPPYSMLVWSLIWRNVIVFGHHLLIFVAIALYGRVPVTSATLLVLPGVAVIVLNGAWVVTMLGIACARYRDVQQLVQSLMQIALFVTPVLFGPEQLGHGIVRRTSADFNVLYHAVDVVRSPLLGRPPAVRSWLVMSVVCLVGWTVTCSVYGRLRRRLAYWL